MKELQAAVIGSELLQRERGIAPRHRLEFDPQSGELRLRPRDEAPRAHATPVDQIASDGFA
ncbi:MAG: hypothetical protein JW942_05530 [Opitutales bacterium]|nr:hypothetical protein [Opitutales bacterium]